MYKQIYTGFAIGSTILGVTGLVQCFKTEGITRTIALTCGVGGTVAALTTMGLGIAYDGKNSLMVRDFEKQISEIETKNQGAVNGLKLEIDNRKSQIKTLETQGSQYISEIAEMNKKLAEKAEQYLKIVAAQDLKITQLQGLVDAKDTRIEDFLENCRTYTDTFFSLRKQNLDALQTNLENALRNEKINDSMIPSIEKRIADIRGLKGELADFLVELKSMKINSFKDVLDAIFTYDNKLSNVKTRWKDVHTQAYKNEVKSLQESLDNSWTLDVVKERFESSMEEVDKGITERYEALLLNNNTIYAQILETMDAQNLRIADLQQENNKLSDIVNNPFEMYGGSHYADNANKVARYYSELLGKKLDCLDWEETELGYKLIFSVRRNPSITLNELKQNESLEQIAYLVQALDGTTPEFSIHSHNATVSLSVQTRRKIQTKPKTIEDIFRENNVIRADNFCSTVAKYHINKSGKPTLRVMSATGGGKGIAVKNLVDYYLKNVDGYELWLSDPQNGSDEDYWDCEKAATTPATATALFNQFAQLLKARDALTATTPNIPILGIFDEFDKKHPLSDKKTASEIWTTIRHHAMRLILIGQSGEVGKNKWTWDEMTNCALLFITDAIATFIKHADKDLQMNPVKLDKFKTAYDKVKTHIDEINQDIDTENQYRLAALYCNGQALLLEIPPAHKGLLNDGRSWLATTPFEKVSETKSAEVLPKIEHILSCPHCHSLNIRKRDKKADGTQLYDCKDCSNSPKKFIPNINYQSVEV